MKNRTKIIFFCCFIWLIFFKQSQPHAELKKSLTFEISFSNQVHAEPITGRIYIIISRNNEKEPRFQTGYIGVPIWGKNVFSLNSGKSEIIDEKTFGCPLKSINEIPMGEYFVQGFINIYTKFKRSDGHTIWLHNDQWEGQRWNRSPGNLYSDVQKVKIDPNSNQTIKIVCDHKIPPVQIPVDTKWVKRIKFKSKMLSDFWGQPIYLGATILLPKGYETHPDVYYPVNYIQGHFSLRAPQGFRTDDPGDVNSRGRRGYEFYQYWNSDDCPRMIAVTFQHPCPYYDDSYAVNSENVGPYGDALLQELIPYIEDNFRIIRKPFARILSGGSTGGWESLALQIFNPDFFGGTFSLCPDPVDFRWYEITNIYENTNAYYEEVEWQKIERPGMRDIWGRTMWAKRDPYYFELAIGDKNRSGLQLAAWEAVYSPVNDDGYPKPLWDWITGEIDKEVANFWKENYDLRYYLEKNWSWLGPKLVGKLHIYTGDMDNYYLNNAVVLLEEFLEKTKNPYYAGVVKYGDRAPHCWGPRGAELFKLIEEYILKNAPDGKDTKKWRYK